jgi:hypothetical protein
MLREIGLEGKLKKYELFAGRSTFLGHYYRHLFQTVKFVVNQSNTFIEYSEKRKYLRILRAQLSDQEQALLFYNWYSDYGKPWENNSNHFFTDYRMIHNLWGSMLFNDFNLSEIFKLNEQPNYQMEKNRKDDFIFEFQSEI